jgi:hypothetical protein
VSCADAWAAESRTRIERIILKHRWSLKFCQIKLAPVEGLSELPAESGFYNLPGSKKGGGRLAVQGTLQASENRAHYRVCRNIRAWLDLQ